jgi:hypothetical protein
MACRLHGKQPCVGGGVSGITGVPKIVHGVLSAVVTDLSMPIQAAEMRRTYR